jgi:hypothetical protein
MNPLKHFTMQHETNMEATDWEVPNMYSAQDINTLDPLLGLDILENPLEFLENDWSQLDGGWTSPMMLDNSDQYTTMSPLYDDGRSQGGSGSLMYPSFCPNLSMASSVTEWEGSPSYNDIEISDFAMATKSTSEAFLFDPSPLESSNVSISSDPISVSPNSTMSPTSIPNSLKPKAVYTCDICANTFEKKNVLKLVLLFFIFLIIFLLRTKYTLGFH